jgi:hypothetical protein
VGEKMDGRTDQYFLVPAGASIDFGTGQFSNGTSANMFAEYSNWSELRALTSAYSVELPGIETDALPSTLGA